MTRGQVMGGWNGAEGAGIAGFLGLDPRANGIGPSGSKDLCGHGILQIELQSCKRLDDLGADGILSVPQPIPR
jgi:hypothetical protein